MHDKLKRMLALLAAIIIGSTAAVSVGAPAQAALSDCTSYTNVVCMWLNGGADGPVWRQTTAQIPSVGCRNITESGWNNEVTTVRLQSTAGWVWRLYDGSNCTGSYVPIYQNSSMSFTYDFSGNVWNDKFSSMRLTVS